MLVPDSWARGTTSGGTRSSGFRSTSSRLATSHSALALMGTFAMRLEIFPDPFSEQFFFEEGSS